MQFRLHSLLVAAVAAFAFVGCTSDDDFAPSGEKKSLSFVATIDGRAHTSGASERMKTQLHPDQHNSVSFVADDAISVFSGSTNNKFTTAEGGASVTFKGEAEETENYYALYPHQADATISGTTIKANFPAEQTAQTGAPYFDPQAALSVATTTNDSRNFYFYNVGCLVKFETEEPYEKIVFRGNSNESVAGNVNITVSTTPSVTGADAQSITLLPDASFGDDRGIPAGTYYIAVLPQTFSTGFSVDAYHLGNTTSTPEHTRTISKNITLERSRVYDIGTLYEMKIETVDLGFEVDGYEIIWASRNIGAAHDYNTGYYFAWGEIAPKSSYTWDDYKWGTFTPASSNPKTPEINNLTKYTETDGLYVLEDEDNAAKYHWGDEWDVPTIDDFKALVEQTDHEWVKDYKGTGQSGVLFINKHDANQKLFLPAAGEYDGEDNYLLNYFTEYWSKELSTHVDDGRRNVEEALIVGIMGDMISTQSLTQVYRNVGLPIRPVKRIAKSAASKKR